MAQRAVVHKDDTAFEEELRGWAEGSDEKSVYRRRVALSKRSSLRIGGPASHWLEVATEADLMSALDIIGDAAVHVVGLGSNTLFPDEGIESPVIKLVGDLATWDKPDGRGRLRAGAGVVNAHIVRGLLEEGWVGHEFLKLIPGTLGGAVALNAGTKEGELVDILESATLAVDDGDGRWRQVTWESSQLAMSYRHCDLPRRAIVMALELEVRRGDVEAARAEMRKDRARRDATQPYRLASVGSTFANPPGDYAGRLIDAAGLKGHGIGGARISETHGNFFINEGDATSEDFLRLMALARHVVRTRYGRELRPEVKFVGFDGERRMKEMEDALRQSSRERLVGLLTGGDSAERAISLKTGEAFEEALRTLGYEVEVFDVSEGLEKVAKRSPEVALLGIHGGLGESGALQGYLESLGIPYTGSGVLASALAMDKWRAREMAHSVGVPVAPGRRIRTWNSGDVTRVAKAWIDDLGLPMVVKLNDSGSSVGVELCRSRQEVEKAIEELGPNMGEAPSSGLLAEAFVEGPEYTVGFFDEECLGVMEIEADAQFYDFEAKYESNRTDYRIVEDEAIANPLTRWAEKTVKALGCRGVCRVDFKGDPTEEGAAVMLEVNTIPGMTETSLVPKLAAHRGMSFESFVEAMVASARLDQGSA